MSGSSKQSTLRKKPGKQQLQSETLPARVARGLAGKFIFMHLRDRYAAGPPELVVNQSSGPFWIVPVFLMPVGKDPRLVGKLKLDGVTGEVISHTIAAEILNRAQGRS